MKSNGLKIFFTFLIIISIFSSCSEPIEWPDSPLHDIEQSFSESGQPVDIDSIKQKLVGHYAHYDVVAYEDNSTKTPMLTFVISYGFTDFYMDNGRLMQSDIFVRANQKINQKNIVSQFNDAAVQAIKPSVQEVELSFHDGKLQMYRPPTPSLLGITGDPSKPLSSDPNDPNLVDPDKDGNPGVTVNINIGKFIKGEIYITRREIFSNYLTLNPDGSLTGYVKDESEQFVIGASLKILAQASDPIQHPDIGMNPVILVPVSEDIDSLEELMALRDSLFPPEPEFLY